MGHGAFAFALPTQNVGQSVMCFGKARLEGYGALKALPSLLRSIELLKRGSPVGEGLRVSRFERDRSIEACERLVQALEIGKCVAAIAEGFGVVRLEGDGRIVACKRLGEPPERLKDDASIVVGESRFGIDIQRDVELNDGVLMVAALGANQPKQMPAGKMPRLLGDCPPTKQLRVFQLSSFPQADGLRKWRQR